METDATRDLDREIDRVTNQKCHAELVQKVMPAPEGISLSKNQRTIPEK
jgi:hypothetical protein